MTTKNIESNEKIFYDHDKAVIKKQFKPALNEVTEEDRARNRRVTFTIKKQKPITKGEGRPGRAVTRIFIS